MTFATPVDNIINEVDLLVEESEKLFNTGKNVEGFKKLNMAIGLCEELEKQHEVIKIDPLMVYGIKMMGYERYKDAIPYLEKANTMIKTVAKPPFEERELILNGLEECYKFMQDRKNLIRVFEAYYGLFANHYGLTDERTIGVMRKVLYSYVNQGYKEKTARLARELLKVAEKKPDIIFGDELVYLQDTLNQAESF